MEKQIITILLFVVTSSSGKNPYIDTEGCKPYIPDSDNGPTSSGLPFRFMGDTYDKQFYISIFNYTDNFYESAFDICRRFDMDLATIDTDCEYGIIENWFFNNFPTAYSCWIAGVRDGDYGSPRWMTTQEPIDLSEFGQDVNTIPGPYFPGGYTPINHPWCNCLSVNRNCLQYTGGPTNPCNQSATYPEMTFFWQDCRDNTLRCICERTAYT